MSEGGREGGRGETESEGTIIKVKIIIVRSREGGRSGRERQKMNNRFH